MFFHVFFLLPLTCLSFVVKKRQKKNSHPTEPNDNIFKQNDNPWTSYLQSPSSSARIPQHPTLISFSVMSTNLPHPTASYSILLSLPAGTQKECSGGFRGPDETVTEERIQHILTEASRAMTSGPPQPGQQDQDSRSTDSKSPASSTHSPR